MYKILEDFLKTNLFKEYEDEYEIVYVLIVGSRLFDLVDEKSDLEVAIFVKNINSSTLHSQYKNHFLIHEESNLRVHWYLQDINITNSESLHYSLFWSMSNFLRNEREDFFYLSDENYLNNINILNENKTIFLEFNLNRIVKNVKKIKEISETEKIKEEHYTKHLYRYIFAYWLLINKEITENDRKFLKILKRIRWLDEDFKKSKDFEVLLNKASVEIRKLYELFNSKSKNYLEEKIFKIIEEYNQI